MSSENNRAGASSRFQVLLNPIRNLADVWGINISAELSEYARSLGIDVSEFGEKEDDDSAQCENVDFAEAALLVQGSTSIYSRKVEYLYGLVYNAVAELNRTKDGKSATENGATAPQENDPDADALLNIDEVDFMTLDDDLVQSADPKSITFQESEIVQPSSAQDATCEQVVPPLLRQATSATGNAIGGANFKMLSAHLHSSGALIMNGCPPLDGNLHLVGSDERIDTKEQFNSHMESNRIEEIPDNDVDHGIDEDDFDPPETSLSIDEGDKTALPNAQTNIDEINSSKPTIRNNSVQRKSSVKPDPFRLLDPHMGDESQSRPLRVGKTYRRPRTATRTAQISDLFIPNNISKNEFLDTVTRPLPRGGAIRNYICCEEIRNAFRTIQSRRNANKYREIFSRNCTQSNRDLLDAEIGDESDVDDFGDDHIGEIDDPSSNIDNNGQITEMGELYTENEPLVMSQLETNDIIEDVPTSDRLLDIATSYQKACQEYMKQRAWMWEKCTIDTNLVERVDNWRLRILPILEDEEKRQEFDIHQCGRDVLDSIKSVDKENINEQGVRASEVFRATEKFEACRMFLATLQLANMYQVEISMSENVDVCDPILRFLDGTKSTNTIVSTPGKAQKRTRQNNLTPLSVRRQPLRPRIENVQ